MYDVIVFDFDGTLVESNDAKYRAFLQLFSKDAPGSAVIRDVLDAYPEASRYRIIEETLRRSGRIAENELQAYIERLSERYGKLAFDAVNASPELPGATNALRELNRTCRLYLSSGTPQEPLEDLVAARNWTEYFAGVYGYPARKPDTLIRIAQLERVEFASILVVGDGLSDRKSAEQVGSAYYPIENIDALHRIGSFLRN